MIIQDKNGNCQAFGTVTRQGGEMKYISDKKIPKYCFSLCVRQKRGDTDAQYLNCCLFGRMSEYAPDLKGGEMVNCAGRLSTRHWKGREGEDRTSTELECDFIALGCERHENAAQEESAKEPQGFQEMDEEEESGELPF